MAPQSSGRTRRDPARRDAILNGARTVFLRDGFAQGSVDDVAAEAGVGKQTIYRHFGSKEGLVVALVEAMCAPRDGSAPFAADSPGASLRALLIAIVRGVTDPDSVRLYRAIVGEADRLPELGRLFWEAGPRPIRAALTRVLSERDEPVAATLAGQLVQLALGDAYQELVLGIGSPTFDTFERQIDAALRLVEWRLPT